MHMPDVLVAHPLVFGGCFAVAGGSVAIASHRIHHRLEDRSVPLMGVMGAFVFAGQMVNFAVPGLGVSGHLGGGALLTALFGPAVAVTVMTAVLLIQCLLFQDGGLLALGANVINMGVLPALVTHGLIRFSVRMIGSRLGVFLGTGLGAWLGLLAGATLVPLMAWASGSLPTGASVSSFLWIMLGLHALIGIGEVCITLAVIGLLATTRPHFVAALHIGSKPENPPSRIGAGILVGVGLGLSLLIGGGLSHLASGSPDGLEASMQRVGYDDAETSVVPIPTAVLADYEQFPGLGSGSFAATLAGAAGTFVSFALIYLLAWVFSRRAGHRASGSSRSPPAQEEQR